MPGDLVAPASSRSPSPTSARIACRTCEVNSRRSTPMARGGATTIKDGVSPPSTALSRRAASLARNRCSVLIVPVGLLHGAAPVAHGAERPPRLVGADLVGLGIVVLIDLPGLQVRRLAVAGVLQNQRLGAVADHDPHAVIDLQCPYRDISKRTIGRSPRARFDEDQRLKRPVGCGGRISSSRRAGAAR